MIKVVLFLLCWTAFAVAAKVVPIKIAGVQSVPVLPSDDLAGSVGVNIHVSYGGTGYDWTALSPSEPSNLTTLLIDLGVRWVRDGGINKGAANQEKQWHEINKAGIKATFISGQLSNASTVLEFYKNSYPGLVGMFEGRNEPELNSGGLDYAYSIQLEWFAAVRNDPYWNDVPVASPSCGDKNYYNVTKYPKSRATSDWLNLHLYTNGLPTEQRAPNFVSGWQSLVAGKPIIITEFGFIGAINNRNSGFSPQFTNGDPDCTHYIDGNGTAHPVAPRTDGLSSHAIYIVRSILEYRRLGVARTIIYELINQRPESGNPKGATDIEKYGYAQQEMHYGLVGTYFAPDGKLRLRLLPAYYAVQRLISWFNDKRQGPKPPSQWAFSLGNPPANVRSLATARKDGSLDLSLWLSDQSCTPSTFHPSNGEKFPNGTCCWRDGDKEVEFAKYNLAVLGSELYPPTVTVNVEFGISCNSIELFYPVKNLHITKAGGASYSVNVEVDPVFVRCNVA